MSRCRKCKGTGEVPDLTWCGDETCCPRMLECLACGAAKRPPAMKDKAMTRPQDWAAPARAHLFGLGTLTVSELHGEVERHAAYNRRAAIEEVHRELRRRST